MLRRLVLGAALLWAVGAYAAPRKPRQPFSWPNPEMVGQFDIPGVTWSAGGIPVQAKWLILRHAPEELIPVYVDAFRSAGFFIPQVRGLVFSRQAISVTGLDVEKGMSYTAVLRPNGDGTTTVICGEANLALARSPAQAQSPIPLYPGTVDTLRSDSEVGQLIAYDAKARPAEVLGFYRSVLGQAGFQEPRPDEEPGFFVGPGQEVRIQTHEKGAKQTHVLAVVHARSPEP